MARVALSDKFVDPEFYDTATTSELIEYLKTRLAKADIYVTVHKAVTTSSVYVKLDHGMLAQCRVGDHKGKGYAYKYEIGNHIKKKASRKAKVKGNPVTTHKYPTNYANVLVQDIIKAKQKLIATYGEVWYLEKRKVLQVKKS